MKFVFYSCNSRTDSNCVEATRASRHRPHRTPRLSIYRAPWLHKLVPRTHRRTCRRQSVLGHTVHEWGHWRGGFSTQHRRCNSTWLRIVSVQSQQRLLSDGRTRLADG